jgi:multidrug efflux pump subunit AcrA (membrane-fusion protein)
VRAQQGGGSPAALGGGGFGGGGNFNFNNGQQQAMRNRFENALSSVLTPEQMEKFRALRSQRGGQAQSRQGTLWTLENGKPKSHEVRLGVADDRFTEVVESDLKPGDKVIVRARTEVRK